MLNDSVLGINIRNQNDQVFLHVDLDTIPFMGWKMADVAKY